MKLALPSDEGRHAFTPASNCLSPSCKVCMQLERHELHKPPMLQRLCEAIETAITSEDGLDGLVGERLLLEVGYWPARVLPEMTREQVMERLRPPPPDPQLSAQPCGCDPGAAWKCEQHRGQA